MSVLCFNLSIYLACAERKKDNFDGMLSCKIIPKANVQIKVSTVVRPDEKIIFWARVLLIVRIVQFLSV